MLWFDNQAEEAANFYVSVFKNSKVKEITHYAGEEFPEKKGQVMTVSFELNGQEFTALNGGPDFKFTEAVSFVINCDTQEEIDPAAAGLGETHRLQREVIRRNAEGRKGSTRSDEGFRASDCAHVFRAPKTTQAQVRSSCSGLGLPSALIIEKRFACGAKLNGATGEERHRR